MMPVTEQLWMTGMTRGAGAGMGAGDITAVVRDLAGTAGGTGGYANVLATAKEEDRLIEEVGYTSYEAIHPKP